MESFTFITRDGRMYKGFVMNGKLIFTVKDNQTAQIELDKDDVDCLIADLKEIVDQLE